MNASDAVADARQALGIWGDCTIWVEIIYISDPNDENALLGTMGRKWFRVTIQTKDAIQVVLVAGPGDVYRHKPCGEWPPLPGD